MGAGECNHHLRNNLLKQKFILFLKEWIWALSPLLAPKVFITLSLTCLGY